VANDMKISHHHPKTGDFHILYLPTHYRTSTTP